MNIRMDKRGAVATLTIDRQKSLNALNPEVLLEIRDAILALDSQTRVLILTGAGEKAFVAGADIAAMSEMSPLQARTFAELGQGVIELIENAPVITIAAINGFALGGGLELALSTDLIYASANAKMGLPETNLGIIPGFGGTANLGQRIGMHRALDLILSGRMMSADEAKDCGLILDIFSASDLLAKVNEIAEKIARKGIHSLLAARRLVRAAASSDKEKAYLLEKETFATLFAGNEPREGMKAFLEKREPKFY